MRSVDTLKARVHERTCALREAGLIRALQPPFGADFSSNDYLALSRHPGLVASMADAVRREGCGSTGSRLLRGDRLAFSAVECRFAALKGTERALYFSSGYLANIAALTTFAEKNDVILSDARNHASLIDGIRLSPADRLIFRHNDVSHLAELVERARPHSAQLFIVVESLFSMDGDLAPLREIADLCRLTGAAFIIDEAHAVGIYGPRGSGLIEASGIADDVFVSINTGGKALGVSGAFVAGPSWAIEYLVQRGRSFIFTTAPPPAVAAALDASLALVEREPERRERLHALAQYARARLAGLGVAASPGTSHIVSVVLGSEERAVRAAEGLQADGFDVRAIRPPTVPAGTARLRISINAGMTEETIDRFAASLASNVQRLTPCSVVSS